MANKRKTVETPLELFIKNYCHNITLEDVGKNYYIPKSTMYGYVYKRKTIDELPIKVYVALQRSTRHKMTIEQIRETLKDYHSELKSFK